MMVRVFFFGGGVVDERKAKQPCACRERCSLGTNEMPRGSRVCTLQQLLTGLRSVGAACEEGGRRDLSSVFDRTPVSSCKGCL